MYNENDSIVYQLTPTEVEGTFEYSTYAIGKLVVSKTVNPNGLWVLQYSEAASGRTVLTNQGGNKTYFVYDYLGRSEYVLPPLAVNNLTINPDIISVNPANHLYYKYTYDDLNRLVEKGIPGKEKELYVYDRLNRPILAQDGNLRKDNKWKFVKYDVFGRMAYWGVYSTSLTRAQLQAAAVVNQYTHETYTYSEVKYDPANRPYTQIVDSYTYSNAYPTVTAADIMEEYVYGTKQFENNLPPLINPSSDSPIGLPYTLGTSYVGLLSRARTRILGTELWITTYPFYDAEGRPVVTVRRNGLNASVQYSFAQYNYSGQLTRSRFVQCDGSQLPSPILLTMNYTYSYTPQGQAQSITLKVNENPAYELVKYEYNALGELVKRNLGKKVDNATYLQEVDYFYNLKGWLTEINKVNDYGSDDLFSMKLHREDEFLGSTARYDGKISGTEWRVKGAKR